MTRSPRRSSTARRPRACAKNGSPVHDREKSGSRGLLLVAAKAAKARELGFEDVIDLTSEGLADGVRRITAGKGVDIVIESIGGTLTSEALSSLGLGGVLITLGYSAGRKTTIDVTDLIWKGARMAGFSLFAQSPTAIATAWRDIIPLIVGGSVKPIVERVYPLGEAGGALRHLIEAARKRRGSPQITPCELPQFGSQCIKGGLNFIEKSLAEDFSMLGLGRAAVPCRATLQTSNHRLSYGHAGFQASRRSVRSMPSMV